MRTLSSIFSSAIGQAGGVIFLIGAGLALYKTVIANVHCKPGLWPTRWRCSTCSSGPTSDVGTVGCAC